MNVQATLQSIQQNHFTTRTVVLSDTTQSYRRFVVMIGALLLATIVYIWQINALAVAGYELKDLEAQSAALKNENAQLEVAIASEQSTQKILARIEATDLVPVGSVSHISLKNTDVALAR